MANRSRADWVELIGAWRASGESAAAFGARRRLNPRTLTWWASKLRKDGVRTVGSGRRGGGGLQLVEITEMLPAARAPFEVVVASGRRVIVPAQFDEDALARLLDVVERAR